MLPKTCSLQDLLIFGVYMQDQITELKHEQGSAVEQERDQFQELIIKFDKAVDAYVECQSTKHCVDLYAQHRQRIVDLAVSIAIQQGKP